jgi:hypothetical protein
MTEWEKSGEWNSNPVSDLNELRVYSMIVWLLQEKLNELLANGDVERYQDMLSSLKQSESSADNYCTSAALIYRLQQIRIVSDVLDTTTKAQQEFMNQQHIQQLLSQLQVDE